MKGSLKLTSPKFELIQGGLKPSAEKILEVAERISSFLRGDLVSANQPVDLVNLYTELVEACGDDEIRATTVFQACMDGEFGPRASELPQADLDRIWIRITEGIADDREA
jgi:hypothetical protein